MDEENAAAAKLQSVKRGQAARAQVKQMRAEENAAASKLQSVKRGKDARDQAARRGKEARKEAAALAQRRKDDPVYQAEEYLKQHKLLELFDLLSQKLVSERPSDPRGYLIAELAKLKETKTPSSPMNFFSGQDVETLYSMYDVSGRGLTRTQCLEAFDALGVRVTMPPQSREGELLDKTAFMSLLPKH